MLNSLAQIINLAQEVSSPLGLEVLDANFSQSGKQRCLRVTIYRKGGSVGLSDCEQVSRNLENLLDNISPPLVSGNYLLEVQSPGLDRKLQTNRDFEVFSGESIELITKENIEGLGNHFTGRLVGCHQEKVTVSTIQPLKEKSKGKKNQKKTTNKNTLIPDELILNLSDISQIKLFVDYTKSKEKDMDSACSIEAN